MLWCSIATHVNAQTGADLLYTYKPTSPRNCENGTRTYVWKLLLATFTNVRRFVVLLQLIRAFLSFSSWALGAFHTQIAAHLSFMPSFLFTSSTGHCSCDYLSWKRPRQLTWTSEIANRLHNPVFCVTKSLSMGSTDFFFVTRIFNKIFPTLRKMRYKECRFQNWRTNLKTNMAKIKPL